MSGKHLLPGFGDEEEDNEDTITRTVEEITALFRDCERRLKEIHNTPDEGSGELVGCLVARIPGRAGGRRGGEGRIGGWGRRAGGAEGLAGRLGAPPSPTTTIRQGAQISHSRRCAKTSSSASPSSCRSAPLLTTPHLFPSFRTPPRHALHAVCAPLRALPAPSPHPLRTPPRPRATLSPVSSLRRT